MSDWVYNFGDGAADGGVEMRALLGGKGANLAEMCKLGLPVPPGFTLTTEVCTHFAKHGKGYPDGLEAEVARALKRIEEIMETRFGDPERPLLV
ncbi:MAG: PEP/pyruvate-binding domain-containing protein, partial [Rhodospirillales bacterium]|nr:PEP/pyruvate-binding domain-containing protein [Rhodospirillales bacterium]